MPSATLCPRAGCGKVSLAAQVWSRGVMVAQEILILFDLVRVQARLGKVIRRRPGYLMRHHPERMAPLFLSVPCSAERAGKDVAATGTAHPRLLWEQGDGRLKKGYPAAGATEGGQGNSLMRLVGTSGQVRGGAQHPTIHGFSGWSCRSASLPEAGRRPGLRGRRIPALPGRALPARRNTGN